MAQPENTPTEEANFNSVNDYHVKPYVKWSRPFNWCEILYVPHANKSTSDDIYDQTSKYAAYVFLHKERIFTASHGKKLEDCFSVLVCPYIWFNDENVSYIGYDGSCSYSSIEPTKWRVDVDLVCETVAFGSYTPFVVKPKALRSRGIGKWILSDLIHWAKENYPNFSIKINIGPFEDRSIESRERVNKFYRHFNFHEAKLVRELNEFRPDNGIASELVEEKFYKILNNCAIFYQKVNEDIADYKEKKKGLRMERAKVKFRRNLIFFSGGFFGVIVGVGVCLLIYFLLHL